MPITFATSTHTGLVRGSNEDSFFAQPPVFMVADGMGGAQAGEVASGMAARAFAWIMPQTGSPQDELAKLIKRINSSIYEAAGGDSDHSGMGTTITAAAIAGKMVGFAHVGDSRAYLWRNGNLRQLTEDHSLVGEMMRQGKITSAEAASHPQRSIITRALGVDRNVDVDTDSIDWKQGDIFLLCSDGLYSMIPDEEITGVFAGGETLTAMADTLVEAALSGGGADNVTVVLFCPDGSVAAGDTAPTEKFAVPAPAEPANEPERILEAADARADAPMAPQAKRSFRQWFASIPGRIATGLLLAAVVLGGAWFVSRQFYYVGVDSGRVSIFRGVPYDFGPWPLSTLYRSSPARFDDLEPFEQERVSKQDVKSLGEAEQMVENYTAEAKARKEEADRKAKEEEDRSKTTTTPSIIPPGALY
ncbi:MAG: Stp1/IreP family PP2C-type Ser/Thr phosphatase [Thermoleophilia bacterium]|jgi:protein phosphatase